jgi:hypothetical protein
MKTLIDILGENNASVNFNIGAGAYAEYYAHIGFEKGKVTINIYDDEGGFYGSDDKPMPYEWIEKIYKMVNELKKAKHLPEFTLKLIETN